MRSALVSLVGAVIFGLGGWLPSPPSTLPVAPALTSTSLAGIPDPCVAKHPWPADKSPAETKWWMEKTFGLSLTGSGWTQPKHRPIVKIIWESIDAMACTPYFADLRKNSGQKTIAIHAGATRSWAWGDWGLTNPNKLTFDFDKWAAALPSDPGRLVRITVHELGHVYQVNAGSNPTYQREFMRLYRQQGGFSAYGSSSASETMSEVIGYYVARCAQNNPYDEGRDAAYYEWAKQHVFKGVEFGPKPGQKPTC